MSSNKAKISKTFLQKKRSLIKSKEIGNKPVIKIKIGPWDEKEDQLLKEWVEKNGAYNWTKCAEYMKERTPKQCREHWKNSLDSNLKVGNWTSEEDLLIMKFYEKYGSWRKMIPMFEGRTENSIKNRFFSQLRKIAIKKRPLGKKQYGTKYGLDILKDFLNDGIKQAEKKYFEENKNMTKDSFANYMIQIENSIKNRKKGKKFIDLNSIKSKNYNKSKSKTDINIHEDEKEYNQMNLEEKDENLETFNNKESNIKNKSGRKKGTKLNIFKTIKNSEESNTREETMVPKETFLFKKKKSKKEIIFDGKTNMESNDDIIKDQKQLEKKISNNDIKNNSNNNNNNNNNKELIRKKSKNIENDKKEENIPGKTEKEAIFFSPQSFHDYKIKKYVKKDSIHRSNSIYFNENEEQKQIEKTNRYNNIGIIYGTSNKIEGVKRGTNIIPIQSFAQA